MKVPIFINELLEKIKICGFEGYLVGGCVRDSILGLTPTDYDIATSATPEEIADIFIDYKVIPTGIAHGTLTIISHGKPVEITTFRFDGIYSDFRHPDKVEFSTNLKEDLARRDFTINALAFNPDVGIIDYFDGINHLNSRTIKCVGDPNLRITEDPLRIMRGIRFSAVLGFQVEENTATAFLDKRHLLSHVARERISSEFIKLICGINASAVLQQYREVIAEFIPEIISIFDFSQHSKYHDKDVYSHTLSTLENIEPIPHLRLTMFFHDIGKAETFSMVKGEGHFYGHSKISMEIARKALTRLKFEKAMIDKILLLIKYHDLPLDDSEFFIKRWLNKLGTDEFKDLVLVHIADDLGKDRKYQGRIDKYNKIISKTQLIIEKGECFTLKDLDIKGHDIQTLGAKGKSVGFLLNQLLEMVMTNKLPNEKEKLLKQAKKMLQLSQ